MEKATLEISWISLWRALFFVVLVTIMYLGLNILLGLFIALIISSGLEGFVTFLEKRGLPRSLGVISVFVVAVVLFIGFIYLLVPLLLSDIQSVIKGLNESIKDLGFGSLLDPEVLKSINNLIVKFSESLFSPNAVSPLAAFSQFLGGVGLAVAVFVSSFYLSLSRDGVERFIRVVLPANAEEVAIRIYERSRRKIGAWFQTQIILSMVVGGLVWIALLFLGVRHAFILALLAALLEIVPYVGPILSGAAGVLVALTSSPLLALYTLIVFLGIQQLENHILVPLLMKRSVGLHPVIVIISLLVGAEVLGFLGMIIAIPAAAVLQEIVEEWSTTKKRPRASEA